jgi:hypothetical protein
LFFIESVQRLGRFKVEVHGSASNAYLFAKGRQGELLPVSRKKRESRQKLQSDEMFARETSAKKWFSRQIWLQTSQTM